MMWSISGTPRVYWTRPADLPPSNVHVWRGCTLLFATQNVGGSFGRKSEVRRLQGLELLHPERGRVGRHSASRNQVDSRREREEMIDFCCIITLLRLIEYYEGFSIMSHTVFVIIYFVSVMVI
jgi:hypothetical protein